MCKENNSYSRHRPKITSVTQNFVAIIQSDNTQLGPSWRPSTVLGAGNTMMKRIESVPVLKGLMAWKEHSRQASNYTNNYLIEILVSYPSYSLSHSICCFLCVGFEALKLLQTKTVVCIYSAP